MSISRTGSPEKTSGERSEILLRAAMSKKAGNPVLIRLEGLTSLADYFLIVSTRSAKQVQAVAEVILQAARDSGLGRFSTEGVKEGNWALLDFGDVVVHVFRRSVREFYDLEGLWSDAPREPIPDDILREVQIEDEEAEDEPDDWWAS